MRFLKRITHNEQITKRQKNNLIKKRIFFFKITLNKCKAKK